VLERAQRLRTRGFRAEVFFVRERAVRVFDGRLALLRAAGG